MICNANGFAQQVLTMTTAASLDCGTPVSLSGNFTAAAASNGDAVFGVALSCRDGVCAVQVQGAVTLPYTGSAPTVGFGSLVCNGSGGVKTSAEGTPTRILAVDSVQNTVTFML
jgi:hypothetical protein